MRSRSRFVGMMVGLLGGLVPSFVGLDRAGAGGQDAAEQARRAAIVVRVGSRTVTAGELEDRLAVVPRFQLAMFGDSPDAIRRKFLADILIPEVLLSAGAEARHLDQQLTVSQALARSRSNSALKAVRANFGSPSDISAEDIKKYYEENRARYDSPERYSVWRILCKTREEAVAVLDAAKKDSKLPNFMALARDHSIDKATLMRGGNLGFVTLDGTSNEAGLKVDPAIVKAAASVKDGEFVAAPVEEGGNFAVVWHRGTVGASRHSVEDVTPQIRETMFKERIEEGNKKLLVDLHLKNAKDVNEALLNTIDISQSDGAIVPRRRPGQVPALNAPVPAKK